MNIEQRTKQKMEGITADIETMAINMYEMAKDQDHEDYEDSQRRDITQLENALYYLQCVANNDYNDDSFRTIYNALILIFDK